MSAQHLLSLLLLPLLIISSVTANPLTVKKEVSTSRQWKGTETPGSSGLSLLNEVIAEAPALRLAENRALVQAIAADLLWASDERRARVLFDEAFASLSQVAGTVPRDEAEQEGLLRVYGEVRQEMLQLAARRDPQLARALLRATGQPAQEQGDELHLKIGLAMQMVMKDPEQAAVLAAETLKRGVSGELTELILRLQSIDHEAAARLASAVVIKLQSSSLFTSEETVQVALDLLRIGSESAVAREPLLDQQALRALAEALAVESTRSPDDNSLLLALQPLLPQVERYAPTRAPFVRRQLTRLNAVASEQGEPPGDDPAESAALTETIHATAKEGQEDEARLSPATTLPTPEERVAVLIESAKAMARKNENGRAIELLEEAHGLIGGRARNLAQFCAQLQVAAAFAPLAPEKSFSIIESAVDHINELANAATTVDGFITERQIARDDELGLKAISGYLSVFPEEDAEGFALLARTRFDDMRHIADRLQRSELRIMARLLILQSVMTPVRAADL